ncbi:MAG: bifunctional riboflavin kinase/FAD synthetase [Ferruginibacter sp.]|nr:bifunctional riboflavin kinase/FAD synthetase [Ferruginibacter sp.]
MNVYKDINRLPTFQNAVVTIGTFDGVHLGHAHILSQLISEAKKINGTPVVITFYPHPKRVIEDIRNPLFILNTPEEKYRLLHKRGIGQIVVVPFDKAFAEQPAADYIRNFLADKFHPHTIIIGYDHRFGKNREGDYKLLEKEAGNYHYKVQEIPEHILQDVIISSTKIREALLSGDIDTAATYLGYHYFFTGTVIEGNKLGRTIGYPTANLQVEDEQKLIPANGVYAVTITMEADEKNSGNERQLSGMMNIGIRPTVDGSKRVIEVNIFDFDELIYGRKLTIGFKKWLRSEVKFNGLDALKQQLAADEIAARAALA